MILTSYGRQLLVSTVFGRLLSPPETLYVALLYSVPNDTDDGSDLDEPVASTGYARLAVPNDYTSFEFDGLGAVVLSEDNYYEPVTADLGRVVAYAICDAATGGSLIGYAEILTRFEVRNGDQVVLPEGTLQFLVNPEEA